MNEYCVELVYEDGCRYLEVKGRSTWRDRRAPLRHAADVFAVKATDGIKKGLIAIDVWKDDADLVKRFKVQP